VLALIALFAAVAFAQETICTRAFSTNETAQLVGMQTYINNVVGAVLGAPETVGYFNGANPGSFDFTDPANSAALESLFNELVAFFGGAIGCTGTGTYGGNTDMTVVHGFATPVNKAAFEVFNQIAVREARKLGMINSDVYTLALVLDGFRTGNGVATNEICQDDDCVTSPYTVIVSDAAPPNPASPFFFNPPYISVPQGFQLAFTVVSGSHTVTQEDSAGAIDSCTALTGGFDSGTITNAAIYSHPAGQAVDTVVQYFCAIHCPPSPMYGAYKVIAAVVTPTTTAATTVATTAATTGGATTRATVATTGQSTDDDGAAALAPLLLLALAVIALLF